MQRTETTNVSDSIVKAWEANGRVNRVLLEHLEPRMLAARSPGGGFSVAQHLAHLAASLKFWTMGLEPETAAALPDLFPAGTDPESLDFEAETDLERIREVMARTEEAALAAVVGRPPGEVGELPHASTEVFLVHMMVHDAHHRGQILLALKTAGHPLPDEGRMWGPWKGG